MVRVSRKVVGDIIGYFILLDQKISDSLEMVFYSISNMSIHTPKRRRIKSLLPVPWVTLPFEFMMGYMVVLRADCSGLALGHTIVLSIRFLVASL